MDIMYEEDMVTEEDASESFWGYGERIYVRERSERKGQGVRGRER